MSRETDNNNYSSNRNQEGEDDTLEESDLTDIEAPPPEGYYAPEDADEDNSNDRESIDSGVRYSHDDNGGDMSDDSESGEENDEFQGDTQEDIEAGLGVMPLENGNGVAAAAANDSPINNNETGRRRRRRRHNRYATSVERPVQNLDLVNVSHFKFFGNRPHEESVIFDNITSEARDLDANERNFLSMLRLALYLGLASCIVLANFRFPSKPFSREDIIERMSMPVGIIFMVLSFIGLAATINNYMRTVTSYAKQRSVVRTTKSGQAFIITSGCVIIAANIVLLICM